MSRFGRNTKTLINLNFRYISILCLLCFSCSNGINKSLISETEKLNSPKNKFTLYHYSIESSMAFGSGFSVINIVNSKDNYDFTTRDFFRLNNDFAFWIKWKNEDTLSIKYLIEGAVLSNKQPIKKEIKKWKHWTFEIEYYSMYSASIETAFIFDSFTIDKDEIKFKSKNDSLIFKKDEIKILLDSNHIYLTNFTVDTFQNKLGLSFSHYNLSSKNSFDRNEFLKYQAFTKTSP